MNNIKNLDRKIHFPTQFQIIHGPENSFDSKLISLKDFPEGEVLVELNQECKLTKTKAYTSVQFSEETEATEGSHFELGSELVYINHSCQPNVAFELPDGSDGLGQNRWCLRSLVDIKKGDTLTFAYFSTEWDMAQPFECQCKSKDCLGTIRGAKHLPKEILYKYFINDHIRKMKESQS